MVAQVEEAMSSKAASAYRELAYRAGGGIEVVLLWHQDSDELFVGVYERSGAHFELSAAADQALDVFNHPYAHAAFRGLPQTGTSGSALAGRSFIDEQIGADVWEEPRR